jgi:hypothetical protein
MVDAYAGDLEAARHPAHAVGAFEYDDGQPATGGLPRGGEPGGAGSENDEICARCPAGGHGIIRGRGRGFAYGVGHGMAFTVC